MAVDQGSDAAGARLALRGQPTPLVRVGSVLVKLESLRPSGGANDRALALWDALAPQLRPGMTLVAAGTGGSALAGAAWAKARGMRLRAVVHGALTDEVRAALQRWGAQVEEAPSRAAALERSRDQAALHGVFLLPPLDGAAGAAEAQGSLGAELVRDLQAARLQPGRLVVPAGARAALLGSFAALRSRWHDLRCVAVVAASAADVLPELPAEADLPGDIELVPVTRAAAQDARARLAREHGISATHASAGAVACAEALHAGLAHGEVVALVTASGERELSLDPPHPP